MDSTAQTPKGHFCEVCQGVRLHDYRISATRGADGQRVRVLACTACGNERGPEEVMIGVSCPNPRCRDTRFTVCYVRHRRGATVRVKVCKGCKRRIRTCEKVESYAS